MHSGGQASGVRFVRGVVLRYVGSFLQAKRRRERLYMLVQTPCFQNFLKQDIHQNSLKPKIWKHFTQHTEPPPVIP